MSLCNCFNLCISDYPQTVETETYRSELAKVRGELEPWEKQLIEHKGKLEVACTESKLLTDKVRLVIFDEGRFEFVAKGGFKQLAKVVVNCFSMKLVVQLLLMLKSRRKTYWEG